VVISRIRKKVRPVARENVPGGSGGKKIFVSIRMAKGLKKSGDMARTSKWGGRFRDNPDGSVTVTDSLFGIPLVSSYDSSGNLLSVTLFGFNVTALFESIL
jgi:hypothetical protein